MLTHGARTLRHNDIMRLISEKLKHRRIEHLIEPCIPTFPTFIKPDLLIVRGDTVYVSDVTVSGEGFQADAAAFKKTKYGGDLNPVILEFVQRDFHEVTKIKHEPIVISLRGILLGASVKFLQQLHFTQFDLNHIVLRCMRGSLRTIDLYFQATFTS